VKLNTAQGLGPIVKSTSHYFALNEYITERLEYHISQLETCKEDALKFHQGAIKELRRFETIREEVEATLRGLNNGQKE
jgi:hypothetical protein